MHHSGRIGHAIMFMGEEGSSNMALSIAFAQYMSCKERTESDSCGQCSSCVKFAKYSHPDVHFYYPTVTGPKAPKKPISKYYAEDWREFLLDNPYINRMSWLKKMNPDRKDAIISTDDSMDLIKDISLKSFEGEARFAIIWLPEKLNVFSSNRLLKIIEEPPQNAYIFLVTENIELVLPTIVSRTQNLRIGKVDPEEMKDWVRTLRSNIAEHELEDTIRMAEGNPLKALKALNNNSGSSDLTDYFINWARLCYQAYDKMPELINYSEDISKKPREEQNQILKYGVGFFRNALLNNHGSLDLTYIKESEQKHVKNFAPLISVESCTKLMSKFEKSIDHLNRYANAKLVFLELSLEFARNINAKNVNL